MPIASHNSKDLDQFLKELVFITKLKGSQIRFVISIRADWLYYLATEIRHLQLGLNVYTFTLTIDYLSIDSARRAIIKPISNLGWKYDDQVINEILEKLLDSRHDASIDKKYIQPTQLQLVVDSLCTNAELNGDVSQAFLLPNYQQSGGVEVILKNYLQNQLSGRKDAWRLLARFIISDGKGSRSLKYSELIAIPDAKEVELEINELVRNGLMLVYEQDKGEKYCRLAHDYIAEAVENFVRLNPDQQGWKLAEEWLARGLEEWKTSSEGNDFEKPIVERNRYRQIFAYRSKLTVDDTACRLLIISALTHGEHGLAYWLSRGSNNDSNIGYILQALCSDKTALQNSAREAIKKDLSGNVPNNSIDRESDDDENLEALSTATKQNLHLQLKDRYLQSKISEKYSAAQAIWTLNVFDSPIERANVSLVLGRKWIGCHHKLLTTYLLSILVVVSLIALAVFFGYQPAGTWETVHTIKSGPIPIVVPDPNDSNRIFAISLGGANPREGNALMMSTAAGWDIIGRDLGKGMPTSLLISSSQAIGSGRMYIAMRGDGVLRSDDGGRTWAAITRGMQSRAITSLAINPNDPNVIFASTDDWRGVLWSTNGGDTWDFYNSLDDEIIGQRITKLVFSSLEGGTLVAGTESGRIVVRRLNSPSWQLVSSDSQGSISTLSIDQTNTVIYAGTTQGVLFRSVDGGNTFERIGKIPRQFRISALSIDPGNSQHIFLTSYGNGGFTLWKSMDGGESWESINALGLPRSETRSLLSHASGLIAGTDEGLFISKDDGLTWELMKFEAPLAHSWQVVMPRQGSAPIYATTGGSIFVNESGDLKDWTYGKGLRAEFVRSMLVDPYDPMIAYAGVMLLGEWSVFATHDGGITWKQTNPPVIEPIPPDTIALSISHDPKSHKSILYAGTMGCGVLKSDNGGMTWDTFGRKRCNEKTTGSSPVDIAGLAASWSNPNIVFASVAEALYRSKDGGQNWEQLSLPPKAPIRDIAVDTVDPMIVYASLGANGMWRSLDGGNTWQEIGNNVFDDAEVSSLRPMPDKKDYLVVPEKLRKHNAKLALLGQRNVPAWQD
jgi:photosystem II stability/assembly factor-like uncharacterized protein